MEVFFTGFFNQYMKLIITTIGYLFLLSCSSNNKSDLIKGKWHYANDETETYIKITGHYYTVENDSPIPEQYIIKGDTLFKGFENYSDTNIIIKLTRDTLIFASKAGINILIKK